MARPVSSKAVPPFERLPAPRRFQRKRGDVIAPWIEDSCSAVLQILRVARNQMEVRLDRRRRKQDIDDWRRMTRFSFHAPGDGSPATDDGVAERQYSSAACGCGRGLGSCVVLRFSATWKLEEAKAKFSEVVRRAHDEGPQYVTVRGKQAVAMIDAAELERLLPANPAVVPLVQFLESLYVEGLDLTHDRDFGRDPAL